MLPEPTANPVHILIADDHEVIRNGLKLILEGEDDFVVVGEAADGLDAVTKTLSLLPDVVLMDLRMPGLNGLQAIEQIRAERPDIAIVILTTYDEDDWMIRGLRLGARGYLLKDVKRQVLFDCLRAAVRGETLLQPETLARALNRVASTIPTTDTSSIALTPREREVLVAVARGDRSKEIALRLGISERTVKAYLANIYEKLSVDSRAAAVAIATQRGLI